MVTPAAAAALHLAAGWANVVVCPPLAVAAGVAFHIYFFNRC